MAEYTQITIPQLQAKVLSRYATEVASLELLGFHRLAFCLEALGPFSAVYQFPILLLTLPKQEVLAFPPPLRLAVATILLANPDPPTIALCMGMGVKLYTAFQDEAILISSTFQSHAVPNPTSPISKSPASPTIESAWAVHRERIQEFERAGKIVRPSIAFDDYVRISHREEDRSQYR